MNCVETRELFSDHVDGGLSPEAEDRLGAHVGACPACRDELSRYEAGLGVLAGRSPEPPPRLGERLARRLENEGLLRGPRRGGGLSRWRSLAATLAVLACGLVVGRLTATPGGSPSHREAALPAQAWGATCADLPETVPPLDPLVWRTAVRPAGEGLSLTAGDLVLRVPRRLASHGPYETAGTVERDGSACLRLRAPLGSELALSLQPGSHGEDGIFLVEIDSRRVFYGRVLWRQQGLEWSLEGRADATELLDLAREIAAGARVEKAGDRT
jgi:hypothetical protein